MTGPALGVCYYPEHWPEDIWAEDARRMAALGLTYVRIGEFAWSRLEPKRGTLDFDWLERAVDILHGAGLKVVLGTPTATPPKWLVDEMPDMLPVDADGRTRGFGSRRHYCLSHKGYRAECARIVTALAKHFGTHPGIAAWQIDNEHGCHDTTLSYSAATLAAFRDWLARKYQSPDALNRAWGNVFWSMEYTSFDEIEFPAAAVTDVNPAHAMDFRRFASGEVVSFTQAQVEIVRRHAPGRDVIHNFMGRTLDFDHFDVGANLDISSWDSYPLGFLEDRSDRPEEWKRDFFRAGDPDFQAFHHDLYRATSGGRWWVMEQQPGPVNWAAHNPTPREGMVRLWTWEAFAHGAEVVSYFRWRQAPFAQEQMHSGLLRPDSIEAPGYFEASDVVREITDFGALSPERADVAIIFDYPSAWAWDIQPQGAEFDYFRLVFDFYRGLRRLGLSIDVVPAMGADITGYKLVVVPGLFAWPDGLEEAISNHDGIVLIGPRSGSKTADFQIPAGLPPDFDALDLKIARVESLADGCDVPVKDGGNCRFWREFVVIGVKCDVARAFSDGHPALLRQGNCFYLAGWPDDVLMGRVLGELSDLAGLKTITLPDGVRLRRCGDCLFAFNYGKNAFDLGSAGLGGVYRLGSSLLEPSGVAIMEAR